MIIAIVEVQVLFAAPKYKKWPKGLFLFGILGSSGALAEQLRSGLQNRVDGCDSRTCLHVYFYFLFARVVELVDTRDLKSLGFTAVRVQVPPRAPNIRK